MPVDSTASQKLFSRRSQRINTLDKPLHEANTKGWMVVDMKNDWRTIFPAGGVQ